MPRQQQRKGRIPSFLRSLESMLFDKDAELSVSWNSNGDHFHVKHPQIFAQIVMPKYFKHKNLSSFVRQLNMYGFHKIGCVQASNNFCFHHEHFRRDLPHMIQRIQRKLVQRKQKEESSQLLAQLKELKVQMQESFDRLGQLQKELKEPFIFSRLQEELIQKLRVKQIPFN